MKIPPAILNSEDCPSQNQGKENNETEQRKDGADIQSMASGFVGCTAKFLSAGLKHLQSTLQNEMYMLIGLMFCF